MIRTCVFIISLLSVLSGFAAAGQDIEQRTYAGLRLGVNLVRPLMVFPVPSRFGMEVVADYNITPKYFAVAEGGFSGRWLDEPAYRLRENGIFFRAGADRNFYNRANDVISLGARAGFSAYNREAPFIRIDDGYWGAHTGSLSTTTFFRQWAEVTIGLKTELFSNVFLGWNMRGKVLLFDSGDRHLGNRYIPGFGSGTGIAAAGFDFYIYYRIPFKFL
jgi:hypothetical protein